MIINIISVKLTLMILIHKNSSEILFAKMGGIIVGPHSLFIIINHADLHSLLFIIIYCKMKPGESNFTFPCTNENILLCHSLENPRHRIVYTTHQPISYNNNKKQKKAHYHKRNYIQNCLLSFHAHNINTQLHILLIQHIHPCNSAQTKNKKTKYTLLHIGVYIYWFIILDHQSQK